MKIAFFVTEFPTISETFIVNQIIELQKSGHLVHIFSQRKPGRQKSCQLILDKKHSDYTWYIDDIPQSRLSKILGLLNKVVVNFQSKNNLALIKTVLKNRSSLSIYNFIPFYRKPSYDVLHAHFGFNGNFVCQLRKLGLFKDARFITTFHGYDLNPQFAKGNFYKNLFESCKYFTVNSLYSKGLLSNLGCDTNKIHLLPVGVDILKFKRKSQRKEDNEIRLIYIGRLIELKGPHLFVEICHLLNLRTSIKFKATIIGNGSMYDDLKRLIEKYNLRSIVSLIGARTQEEIIEYMDQADLFLLPGLTLDGLAETQGLVIQEAQAMKVPVLVSDAGGMKEGLVNNVTGFVLPENNLTAFVEKIKLLAADLHLRQSLGEAGRLFVEKKFDIELLNQELLKLYEDCA